MKQPNYDNYARFYDFFELAGYDESEELNIFLDELFQLNGVSTVVDFACGTGAQSIGLARLGYEITAADLNPQMLELAREKARKHGNLPLSFSQANMVSADFGIFDAAICIFNAIGHLTPEECQTFFNNARNHLRQGGIFVVDIFNYEALAAGAFAEYSYLNRELLLDGKLINHVRNCELNESDRTISIQSKTRCQNGSHRIEEIDDFWVMQVYDKAQLENMLKLSGFSEIQFFGPTGTEFEAGNSDSILAVCQK